MTEIFLSDESLLQKFNILGVRVIMLNEKEEVLLFLNHKLGKYVPPGGWVDPGETPEDAAVRELKEEIGVDIDKTDLILIAYCQFEFLGKEGLTAIYLLRHWTGEVSNLEPAKHSDLCWFTGLDKTELQASIRPALYQLRFGCINKPIYYCTK